MTHLSNKTPAVSSATKNSKYFTDNTVGVGGPTLTQLGAKNSFFLTLQKLIVAALKNVFCSETLSGVLIFSLSLL